MPSRMGRVLLLSSSALASLYCLGGMGSAQTPITLPTVNVEAPPRTMKLQIQTVVKSAPRSATSLPPVGFTLLAQDLSKNPAVS
jgi:hypothetical protein